MTRDVSKMQGSKKLNSHKLEPLHRHIGPYLVKKYAPPPYFVNVSKFLPLIFTKTYAGLKFYPDFCDIFSFCGTIQTMFKNVMSLNFMPKKYATDKIWF